MTLFSICIGIGILSIFGNFWIQLSGLIGVVILVIYVAADAYLFNRKQKEIQLKQYNKWYIYLILYIASAGINYNVGGLTGGLSTYRVPVGSMMNTIRPGDWIFSQKFKTGIFTRFTAEDIERNDLVIFPYPKNPEVDFIKRVIGIEGDEIELMGEAVYINGKLEKGDHRFIDKKLFILPDSRKFKVPKGKLWVMGDNRRNSKDSRFFGFVDASTVSGKAKMVYWSKDHSGTYHFDRIGTILR